MRLPDTLKRDIFDLLDQLLVLLDGAAETERNLFETYGETAETLGDLEILVGIREQVRDTYRRLGGLLARAAEGAPDVAAATMELLVQSYEIGRERLGPLERSVQEIRSDWELP
ncbi:hypothetical protein [Gloeobacter morelensis]|uniref:HPt domain-containing protein n=1 Tax=Gloeobacter morelensis MG652769 TaxID=2781736 RepID=A0ABY3PRV4_9CYAN|nr:hypothetical protein [Gloeobacter morelensis]UFP96443.1 hypothetical protein ISF26_09620 [Gloeobacter morelensis MG652769]